MQAMGTASDPSEGFYATLADIDDFSEVAEGRHYVDVPESWCVVITDVRGSTAAIEAGRYRDVNALGVASIVAVRNAVADLEIPYVFGGDGATMLVPSSRLEACSAALRGARALARDAFGFELRAGIVPVRELNAHGQTVRTARFLVSPHVRLAMLSGGGLGTAERWIKDPETGVRFEVSAGGSAGASFDGFECRWQPVPSRRGRMVSLLVVALGKDEPENAAVYREVIRAIDQIGQSAERRPVTLAGLNLTGPFGDYSVEARVRSGQASGRAFEEARGEARKRTFIGKVLLGVRASAGGFDGASYRQELVQNTDFRKFDDTLRMVLDLAADEEARLEAYLKSAHGAGKLAYGLHGSQAALVSCLVRSYAGDHLHFVDGADGGYALAAKQLKALLKARR